MSAATVIEVELLSGRYHAHMWGESQFGMAGPEWPPSPWRLLRALAAAWFTASPKPCEPQELNGLLEALGKSDPTPELWLPPASFHEVRYYQPIVKAGKPERVLHHDYFAVPQGGRFWFKFHVDLGDRRRKLLEELLRRIRYFGRSESRARLRLVERDRPPDGVDIVRPRCAGPPSKGDDFVYRRVLCPAPGFQASDLWQVRGGSATDHLVDALIERKMPLPHGAQWVEYALPARLLVHEVYVPRKSALPTLATVPVAEVRFRLNCRIPIPATLLVAVARAFRDEAVRTYRSLTSGQPSRALTGREADGSVAKGHRHLFYLPRLRENTLWVEHLHVVVPEGHLRPDELEALLRVQRIRPARLPYPVTVVLEELIETRAPAPKSCQWISVTPFLMPLRHRRPRQIKTYEEEAAEWMKRLLGVYPQAVRLIPGPGGSGTALPLLAHRYDHGSWTFTRRLGRWLLVTFPHPISIDSPIGGDAHFGAGQFDARPHGGSV